MPGSMFPHVAILEIMEKNIKVIGSMRPHATRGSADGVSPCRIANAGMGGGHVPMIVQRPHGFNNGGLFPECAPTVTSSSWQDNNHLAEPAEEKDMESLSTLYYNQRADFTRKPLPGLSRTIKSDSHPPAVVERGTTASASSRPANASA